MLSYTNTGRSLLLGISSLRALSKVYVNPDTLESSMAVNWWNPADPNPVPFVGSLRFVWVNDAVALLFGFQERWKIPARVSDVFNVKYCNEEESSNPCLGKASQYREEFIQERKTSFAILQRCIW